MEDVLRRQSRLEMQEMDRLVRLRDDGGEDGEYYVKRFVCGMSFEEAEESCSNIDNIGSSSSDGTSSGTSSGSSSQSAHYCPAGSSSQCPSDMECYSYVSCPRSSSGEEPPPLIDDESMRLLNSLLARSTEPILLLNSTDVDDTIDSYDHVGTASLMMEEWTTFHNREDSEESQSILGRILSTFLSSHYGLN